MSEEVKWGGRRERGFKRYCSHQQHMSSSSSLEFSWGGVFIYLFSTLIFSRREGLMPSLFMKVQLGGHGNAALHAADGFMLPSFLSWKPSFSCCYFFFLLFGRGEWGRKGEENWDSRLARALWYSSVKTGWKGGKTTAFYFPLHNTHISFFQCFLYSLLLFDIMLGRW